VNEDLNLRINCTRNAHDTTQLQQPHTKHPNRTCSTLCSSASGGLNSHFAKAHISSETSRAEMPLGLRERTDAAASAAAERMGDAGM